MMCLKKENDSIGIIVFFLDEGPDIGLSFVRAVREYCEERIIKSPDFLIFPTFELPTERTDEYAALGAECLPFATAKQVYLKVRNLIRRKNREQGRPRFHVIRLNGVPIFFLDGPAKSVQLELGPRVLNLMVYLAVNARTLHSTLQLADAADISIGYVRIYLARLRRAYDEARLKVGVQYPGKDVFWTGRVNGEYGHQLKANVFFV